LLITAFAFEPVSFPIPWSLEPGIWFLHFLRFREKGPLFKAGTLAYLGRGGIGQPIAFIPQTWDGLARSHQRLEVTTMRCRCTILYRTALVAFAAAVTAGCGGPKTYPVKGKVEFKGGDVKMLAGWRVGLRSVSDPETSASGTIEEDGSFEVGTVVNDKLRPGVQEGTYRVRVEPPDMQEEGSDPSPLIDARFQNFDKSGLEFTVTRGENDLVVTVEKPRP
jgi:hypothetical protein